MMAFVPSVGRTVMLGFMTIILLGMLGGCETVKGVGKDITNTSQRVQDILP